MEKINHCHTVSLNGKKSAEIYKTLLELYENDVSCQYYVFELIKNISMKKFYVEQLADNLLGGKIFSSSKPYEIFSKKIDTEKMIHSLNRSLVNDYKHRLLLLYYAAPALKENAKSSRDNDIINEWVEYIKGEAGPVKA